MIKTLLDTRRTSDALAMGYLVSNDPQRAGEACFQITSRRMGGFISIDIYSSGGGVYLSGEKAIRHVADVLLKALEPPVSNHGGASTCGPGNETTTPKGTTC